jgi:hypothetical protein
VRLSAAGGAQLRLDIINLQKVACFLRLEVLRVVHSFHR